MNYNPDQHDAIREGLRQFAQMTHQTAQYPKDQAATYLACGLVGEFGELQDKHSHREEANTADWLYQMTYESGDIWWYVCQIIEVVLCKPFEDFAGDVLINAPKIERSHSYHYVDHALFYGQMWTYLPQVAEYSKKIARNGPSESLISKLEQSLIEVLRILIVMDFFIGRNPMIVMNMCSMKLLDRLDRNVIKSEGDTR